MRVKEACSVLFLIRKIHKSNIVYDVVDMNACRLLLYRPWLFNVNAAYRGMDNVYELW